MDQEEGLKEKRDAEKDPSASEPSEASAEVRRRLGEPQARSTHRSDRGFTRFLEVTIAVAAAVQAAIAWYQWSAMKASNSLTRAAVEEARKNADAAVKGAQAAVDAVAESKRQFDLIRTEAEAAAATEKKQFEATLSLARKQLVETVRARVSVVEIDVDLSKPDLPIVADLYNGGVGAAEQLSAAARWSIGKPDEELPLRLTNFSNPLSPNGKAQLRASMKNPSVTQDVVDLIKSGSAPLVIWIVYRYSDRVSGEVFNESACFSFDSTSKSMTYCKASEKLPPPPRITAE